MKIKLAYGRNGLEEEFPDHNLTVVEPEFVPGLSDLEGELEDCLGSPLASDRLVDIVSSGDKVAIAICDATRAMPSGMVLPAILRELNHLPDEKITILIATGTHRPTTDSELVNMVGSEIMSRYRIRNHLCTNPDELIDLGRTESGIPVVLNRDWVESDIRITTGFVEPHFFAGFSGGPKLVAPGLAGLETIQFIHSYELIASPQSTWGVIEDNPLHSAIREIAAMTGVHFSLDVTLNRYHRITSVQAGDIFAVHERAREFTRRVAMREVEEPFDVVVTTNSGYPLDLNLYQTVKGLSGAARIVKQGGTIICASECSDGLPPRTDFARMVEEMNSPESFLKMISEPGFQRPDQWQVQVMAQVMAEASVCLKADGLSTKEIESSGLEPIQTIQSKLAEIIGRQPQAGICVLPEGPQTIPFLKNGR